MLFRSRIPENGLKFAVGVMVSAFGMFWLSEGLGFSWPGSDLVLPGLVLFLAMTALIAVPLLRRRRSAALEQKP